MAGHRRLLVLASILLIAGIGSTSVAITHLADAALREQEVLLRGLTSTLARLIGSLGSAARTGPEELPAGALELIQEVGLPVAGFGETGEWLLAQGRPDGETIRVLPGSDQDRISELPRADPLAVPLRRALNGETGSMVAIDAAGRRVLAAYQPIGDQGLGLVVKMDLAEFSTPVLQAVGYAGLVCLLLLSGGALLVLYYGIPIVRRSAQEHSKYRILFDFHHDGVLLLDEAILECNSSWCRLVGLGSPHQATGRRLQEFAMGTEDQEGSSARRLSMHLEQARSTGRQRFLVQLRRQGNMSFMARMDVAPVAIAGRSLLLVAVHDVSEEQVANEAMQESAAYLEDIFDSIGDGVVCVDVAGNVQRLNLAAERLCGRTETDAVGQPFAAVVDLQPQDAQDDWTVDLLHIVLHEKRVITFGNHAEVVDQDGRRCAVLVSASPVIDQNKTMTGAVLVLRDISHQRRLEDQLRHAQKMQAIGQLAGGVAHDFNNLLTGVVGYANLLRKRLPEEGVARDYIEAIYQSGMQATLLAGQLLAFGRKQVLHPIALDLNAAVRETVSMLERVVKDDITITLELAPALARVKLDPVQFQQVLINLAINASDAMPDGGRLLIRTQPIEVTRSFLRTLVDMPRGRYVVLEVDDEGVGIPDEVREHIFEPFFTTKQAGKGTGLGLATVHGIVTQSGGFIEVASRPGAGTVFQLFFPAVIGDEPADPDPIVPATVRSGGGQCVLVVDNDELVRRFAERVLLDSGYRVVTVSRPSAAILYAEDEAQHLDLLLTDCVMPEMSGEALAEAVLERRPGLRVLYMSGYGDDLPRTCTAESSRFLAKPFTDDRLLGAVASLLAREHPGSER